jgi:flagellar hook assembly protein FlgD
VAVAGAVVALLAPAPATAAIPASTPVFTAPAPGAVLSGAVALEVGSGAPSVRLRVDIATPAGTEQFDLGYRDVVSGSATLDWETWGYPNGTAVVTAFDCEAPQLGCAATGTTLAVTLANAAPVITAPLEGATLSGTVVVTATAPEGALSVDLESGFVAGATDAGAPYAVALDLTRVPDGPARIVVRRCSAVCSGPSAARDVTTSALHPRVIGPQLRYVSPDGDGRNDRATFALGLDTAQTVTWEVRRLSGGSLVRGPVSLGRLPAGTHRVSWSGRDNAGRIAADGRYTVVIRSVERWRYGATSTRVTLDTQAPTATYRPRDADDAVYPYKDGFRDTFRPWVDTRDTLSPMTGGLVVARLDGRVVRRLPRAAWNGRDSSGAALPAGTYRWRVVVTDRAGNRAATTWHRVVLSWRRTVDRTFVLTVAAASGSLVTSSDCAGSAASRWSTGLRLVDSCPTSDLDAVAEARWVVSVPPAAEYTSVALTATAASPASSLLELGLIGREGYTVSRDVVVASASGSSVPGPAVGRSQMWRFVRDGAVLVLALVRPAEPGPDVDLQGIRLVLTAKVFAR